MDELTDASTDKWIAPMAAEMAEILEAEEIPEVAETLRAAKITRAETTLAEINWTPAPIRYSYSAIILR